jgi:hypothetical protein
MSSRKLTNKNEADSVKESASWYDMTYYLNTTALPLTM